MCKSIDMETNKIVANFEVIIRAVVKEDGRIYINLEQPTEGVTRIMDLNEIRSTLAGALALSIRASKNEGAAMKEVIDYLNDEFINVDSFSDLKTKKFGE